MAVPSAITDLSTTAGSNSPTGGESIGTNADDYIRAHASFIALLRDSSRNLTAGTSAAPTIAPAADTDTGIMFPAANKVALVAGSLVALVAETVGVSVNGVVNASGLLFGRSGGIGLGRIRCENSSASSMAAGDLWLQY